MPPCSAPIESGTCLLLRNLSSISDKRWAITSFSNWDTSYLAWTFWSSRFPFGIIILTNFIGNKMHDIWSSLFLQLVKKYLFENELRLVCAISPPAFTPSRRIRRRQMFPLHWLHSGYPFTSKPNLPLAAIVDGILAPALIPYCYRLPNVRPYKNRSGW